MSLQGCELQSGKSEILIQHDLDLVQSTTSLTLGLVQCKIRHVESSVLVICSKKKRKKRQHRRGSCRSCGLPSKFPDLVACAASILIITFGDQLALLCQLRALKCGIECITASISVAPCCGQASREGYNAAQETH